LTAIDKLKGCAKYLVVTPIPTLTYTTKYFNPFVNASWDFGVMAPILFSIWGSFFGGRGNEIVYGVIIVTIIGLIWIRQEDAGVPLFLMFILSNFLFWTPGIFPTEWKWFMQALMYLVVVGIAYTLYRGRRTS
jgi:hypothetical protein